jgi:hypothetical protein
MEVAIALIILLPLIGITVGIFKSSKDSVSAGFAYGFMGALGLIIAGLVLWVILGGMIVLIQAIRGHH